MNIWLVLMDIVAVAGIIGSAAIMAVPNAKLKAKFDSVGDGESRLANVITIVGSLAVVGWATGVVYVVQNPIAEIMWGIIILHQFGTKFYSKVLKGKYNSMVMYKLVMGITIIPDGYLVAAHVRYVLGY